MNTTTATAASRASQPAVAQTFFGKLRALAQHALTLHLQNCAVIAEAYRRPQ
jgi:hypothetical protein